MNKKLIPLTLLAVGLVAMAVYAGENASSRLSAYGYVGRTKNAAMIVDVDAARNRGAQKYIPLEVWLGHTENRTLHVNRDSFTLTDPSGKVHHLASPKAVLKGYGPTLIGADYRYIRSNPDYGGMLFLSCVPIPGVAFYANPDGWPGILYDHVELPNRTFLRTLLYFRNPDGMSTGTYTLTFHDAKSGTTIKIPFHIPWNR